MSLFIASLNSGSNANCYYVGTSTDAVLIDAGLSCRETLKRLSALNIEHSVIKAIFISHEHTDHVKGLDVLSRKLQLPVYINPGTHSKSGINIDDRLLEFVQHGQVITLGNLQVEIFSKHHDAADPVSFLVSSGEYHAAVITDLGHACENVKQAFSRCQAAILEANYDDELLDNGPYPFYLKQRIKSNKGHLSNAQALNLVREHASPDLCQLVLAHLSKENNDPHLVNNTFLLPEKSFNVHVASRYTPSPVFKIYKQAHRFESTAAHYQTELFDTTQ